MAILHKIKRGIANLIKCHFNFTYRGSCTLFTSCFCGGGFGLRRIFSFDLEIFLLSSFLYLSSLDFERVGTL
jgi:hypothetical protein